MPPERASRILRTCAARHIFIRAERLRAERPSGDEFVRFSAGCEATAAGARAQLSATTRSISRASRAIVVSQPALSIDVA